MLKEYYYDKYTINTVWNTNPSGATNSKALRNNNLVSIPDWYAKGMYDEMSCIYSNVREEPGPDEPPLEEGEEGDIVSTSADCTASDLYEYNSWTSAGYQDYEIINEPFNGMPNCKLRLVEWLDGGWPEYTVEDATWNRPFRRAQDYQLDKVEGFILKDYAGGWGSGWDGESWLFMYIGTVKELQKYTAYEHKSRGTLLEEGLIRNETFPVNGVKNGFWWVRGEEYTIPAPVLISPENAFLVNVEEGETVPHLVFETTPRHVGETIKYHVRIRFARTSDFINPDWVVDTRFDRTGVEVENPSTGVWEPFPVDGVLGQRKVRYLPATTGLDFGFYYWDATQWHSFWGYGASANPRMLIVITDSDEVYYLVMNGRPYKATKLTTQESSNGEIGSINLEILNNNI